MKCIVSKLSVSLSSGQAIETAGKFIYHSAFCFCIKYNWNFLQAIVTITLNKNKPATSDISMWALLKQN